MKRIILVLAVAAVLALAMSLPAAALTVAGFGPGGSVQPGTADGVSFGSGGDIFQLDAYVQIDGQDLNGGAFGSSAQLSQDALPAGLDLSFASSVSADTTDLTLRYTLTNNTGAAISSVSFSSYVDAEIDEPRNTFFNEFGQVDGVAAPGQSFEIDEPGFAFGDLPANLQAGALDGTNAVPVGSPDDVAMALGFDLGSLAAGEAVVIRILLSEDGDRLGGLALTQQDTDPSSLDRLTFSGQSERVTGSPIPEPGAALLFATGSLVLSGARARRRADTSEYRRGCARP